MRLLALLTLAILLAGCIQGSTPAPGGATNGTSTPVSTTPTSPTAARPTPSPTGQAAVRPTPAGNVSQGYVFKGQQSATLILAGQNVTFSFVATNLGPNGTALSAPCDGGNPRIEIQDPNGTAINLTAPQMRCMVAMSWEFMINGGQRFNNLTWNGTFWNGTAQVPAPPGTYHAVATFVGKRGDQEVDVVVRLPIGVTDNRGAL